MPTTNENTSELTEATALGQRESSSSTAWVAIENLLSHEWDIGGPAMPVEQVRTLVAGE